MYVEKKVQTWAFLKSPSFHKSFNMEFPFTEILNSGQSPRKTLKLALLWPGGLWSQWSPGLFLYKLFYDFMKYIKFNALRWKKKKKKLDLLRFECEITRNYLFQIWSPTCQEPERKQKVMLKAKTSSSAWSLRTP